MRTRSMWLALLPGSINGGSGQGMGHLAALFGGCGIVEEGVADARASCDRGLRDQLRHAEQVVRTSHEVRPQPCPVAAAVAGLPQAADRLAPTEDLLDPLPTPLAYRVARMPGRARIDPRAAVLGDVLRDVRSDAERTHL